MLESQGPGDQILHRLLVQFVALQEQQSGMRVLLQALIASHPDRGALLKQFDAFATIHGDVDLAQPMEDVDIERRRDVVAAWRKKIEQGGF